VLRDPTIAKEFKSSMIERAWRTHSGDPQRRKAIIDRINSLSVDHMQDLQVGGGDVVENLWLLDRDTNSAIGFQVWAQIRDMKDGEAITDVIIDGLG